MELNAGSSLRTLDMGLSDENPFTKNNHLTTNSDSIDLVASSNLINLKKRLLEDDLPTSSNITNIINLNNMINNNNNNNNNSNSSNNSNNTNGNSNKINIGLWSPFTSRPFQNNHHHNSIESLPSMHNINNPLTSSSPNSPSMKPTTTKPIIQLSNITNSPNSASNTPNNLTPISVSDSSSLSTLALITTNLNSPTSTPGLNSTPPVIENPCCPKCSTPATRRHDKRRWWCKQCTKSFTPYRKEKKAIMGDMISNTAPHCCRCFQQATRKHDKRRWWCKQCKKPFTPTQFNLSEQPNQLIYVMGSNKFNDEIPSPTCNNTSITEDDSIKIENENHKKFKDDVIELIYKSTNNISNMMNKSKNIEIPTLKTSTGINSLLNPSTDVTNGNNINCSNNNIEVIKESPKKKFKSSYSPSLSSLTCDLPTSSESFTKEDVEIKHTLNKLYSIVNNNSNNPSTSTNSIKSTVNSHLIDQPSISSSSSSISSLASPTLASPQYLIPSSKYIQNQINITNSYDIINNDEYSRTTSPMSSTFSSPTHSQISNSPNPTSVRKYSKSPSEVILDHTIETLIQFNGVEETPFVILDWFEKSNHYQILQKIVKMASIKQQK